MDRTGRVGEIALKIFSLGIDQLTINDIKNAGFNVVTQNVYPDPAHTEGHMLMVTSDQVSVQALSELRYKYPSSMILYLYLQKGIRGYQAVHMLCESLGLYFIPPRSTSSAVIEKIRFILEEDGEERTIWLAFLAQVQALAARVWRSCSQDELLRQVYVFLYLVWIYMTPGMTAKRR